MVYDVKDSNNLMRRIFPNVDEYMMNSITPSLSYNGDNVIVSMLLLADDFMLQDFKKDKDDCVEINTNMSLQRNKKNIGKDIVIRFDFLYKTGHPTFEVIINGDNIKGQTAFVNALRTVDKIYIWVVDNNKDVIKIIELEWEYKDHSDTLDKFSNEVQDVKKCPICGNYYFELGALSRKDNKTEICSDCGVEEALS